MGQHVCMVNPLLNIALQLLPKMSLQQQATVPRGYPTVLNPVRSLDPAA